MSHSLRYRPDIDGLRGLAILLVVLFHLEIQGIEGGFIGVDIFFVISGYLITAIILRDSGEGRFSYAEFYERRIRRLLPALTVVLCTTFVAAWVLLLPFDFRAFSHGLAAAAVFVANIYYRDTTDYFGDPVERMPLLHTWSLSVEEQFYLFFPPLLLFLLRKAPRRLSKIMLGLALLSLVAAQYALQASPESAFYLVHLRAWELLAGAVLAIGVFPVIAKPRWRNLSAVLGLLLIVGSAVLLDKDSSFPGISVLPTILGTILVIHAGSRQTSAVTGALSWRPLVFLGLISYSLYLWHWPLFVLVRYYRIEPLNAGLKVVLFLIALALAWTSWRYVEQPFRTRRWGWNRRLIFNASALLMIGFVMLSMPGGMMGGAPFRMPESVVALAAVAKEEIPFRKMCFGLPYASIRAGEVCPIGAAGKRAEFILWGDSHALALAPGFDQAARRAGRGGVFLGKSSCPPAMDTIDYRSSRHACRDFNRAVVAFLDAQPEITTAILVARWPRYARGKEEMSFAPAQAADWEAGRLEVVPLAIGLARTLSLLQQRGIRVIIVDDVPNLAWDPPSVLARAALYDRVVPDAATLERHRAHGAFFRRQLQQLEGEFDFSVLNLDRLFCPVSVCQVEVDGRPLYRDSHHLSHFGAETAADALSVLFAPALLQ